MNAFQIPLENPHSNYIKLRKRGISTTLTFFYNDIILENGGNWFDFGMHIDTYLNKHFASSSGFLNQGTDHLECKNPFTTRDCYLNGDPVQGFTEARWMRCNADSECGSGKCIDKLCVASSSCSIVRNNGNKADKLDIAFVADEYDSEAQFMADVTTAIEKGLISVSPFKENSNKLNFYKIYSDGQALPRHMASFSHDLPTDMFAFATVHETISERSILSLARNCALADQVIVLTRKQGSSFPFATGIEVRSYGSFSNGVSVVFQQDLNDYNPRVIVHEFAHTFGGLKDEYHEFVEGLGGNPGKPNCLNETEAREEWGRLFTNEWKGCGGPCDSRCNNLLRPTETSLMDELDQEFNEVSINHLALKLAAYR